MTSSLICKNFSQNAWKKDLCSNCFKSEVEHWPAGAHHHKAANHHHSREVSAKLENHNENLSHNANNKHNINAIIINNNHNRNLSMNMKNIQININARHQHQSETNATIIADYNSNTNTTTTTTTAINNNHTDSDSKRSAKLKSTTGVPALRKPIALVNSHSNTTANANLNHSGAVSLRKRLSKLSEQENGGEIGDDCADWDFALHGERKTMSLNASLNSAANDHISRSHGKPLVGILKTSAKRVDYINYRPTSKCLVFKEGDPVVISDTELCVDNSADYDDDESAEEEDEEDDDEIDEEDYHSDDKQLRELTTENTKYNSCFANLSADKSDSVATRDTSNVSVTVAGVGRAPDLTNANEYQLEVNAIYSPLSDVALMSTSSDSSSGDEKDDSPVEHKQAAVNSNLNNRDLLHVSHSPASESEMLSIESDDGSECGENGVVGDTVRRHSEFGEFKDELPLEPRDQLIAQPLSKSKPVLPTKPNIIIPQKPKLFVKPSQSVSVSPAPSEPAVEDESHRDQPVANDDSQQLPKIVSDHIYQEVGDKISDRADPSPVAHKIRNDSLVAFATSASRELKLAELALELEQMRQVRRPAPKPPKRPDRHDIDVNDGALQSASLNDVRGSTKKSSSSSKFSIKKLLQKKTPTVSDPYYPTKESGLTLHAISTPSDADAMKSTPSSLSLSASDPKAWKHSDFDRSKLKIIHPTDLVSYSQSAASDQSATEAAPEAPPRTPKPSRPVVPTRKKSKLVSPSSEPPPPPERQPSLSPTCRSTKQTIADAYVEMSKLNHDSLLAIRAKIESSSSARHEWSDFEIGTGERFGQAMVYRDAIVSATGKSVNLIVLPECYLSANTPHFVHHDETVAILDSKWQNYHLLDELTAGSFEERQTNSLILQLYSILEAYETGGCHRLPSGAHKSVLLCASPAAGDSLLILPFKPYDCQKDDSEPSTTLHEFLSLILAKLLPNSLFESVGHVLCQRSVSISQTKTIVQLIAFQAPLDADTNAEPDYRLAISRWFDVNRAKFVRQFLAGDGRLTQLDYVYLKFLLEGDVNGIRSAITSRNELVRV